MPADFEVYDLLEQATNDVLKEINTALRAQRVPPKMGAINLELSSWLVQTTLFDGGLSEEDVARMQELRERVQRVIQSVSLEPFRRDKVLKAIREDYKQTQSQQALIEALDEFFIENELYRDVPKVRTALEQIQAEDLTLIAYEVYG
jgi:hypothetical protein